MRRGLQISEGQTILSIAAAGDNALALLLDNPKKVIALDMSASQLALCHLKVAGINHLNLIDFKHLLGFPVQENHVSSRVDIYKRIRSSLPDDVREFWENNINVISNGIIHCGKLDKYMSTFGKYMVPIVHSRDTVNRFLKIGSVKAQKHFFDRYWNTFLWRFVFRFYNNEIILGRKGRDPLLTNALRGLNVSEYMLHRFNQLLTEVPIADNFFMEYFLTGNITGLTGYPEYLQEENFMVLKQRIDRLELIHDDILSFCCKTDLKFDGFNLTDIFEWLPESLSKNILSGILEKSNINARLCYWNFFFPTRASLWFPQLKYEEDLSEKCHKEDRVFAYSKFLAETVTSLN